MKQYNGMKPATLAHLADTRLGYQKDAVLQKLESKTFEYVISDIIQRGVGAVLFCGDTFHVNIPEVRVQKLAIKQLMRLKNNMPVYTIYGSHDFSPLSNSFIDVLVAVGLMQKLSYMIHEGKVRPTLGGIWDIKDFVVLLVLCGPMVCGRSLICHQML